MRIAILADPLDTQTAGIHVFTREMVNALLAEGGQHEYILVRQRRTPGYTGARQVVVPGIPLLPGFRALRLFFLIPLVLRWLKVDAVIEPAHFGPFNLPRRVRRITVIHDLTPILFPHLHRWHSRLLQRLFFHRIFRNASLLVANSRNTAADIERYEPGATAKTIALHLGCDPGFSRDPDPEALVELGITEHYVLYVGTIEPRKDLDVLLEGFDRLKTEWPEPLQLVIAGERGWKTEKFDKRLASSPNRRDIRLLGYVSRAQLPALYSGCAVFVFPSRYEGFGLPVLEAMGCGAPSVVANNSSLPEVGGKAVLYFETGDAGDLVEKMRLVLADKTLAARLADDGIARARDFTWTRFGNELSRALDDLARG